MPTLATVFFVHSAVTLQQSLQGLKQYCRTYLKRCLSYYTVDTPFASSSGASQTLCNVLFKAFVSYSSDRECTLGCLRKQEKLSVL